MTESTRDSYKIDSNDSLGREEISVPSEPSKTIVFKEQKPTLKQRFLEFWRIARPLALTFLFDIAIPIATYYFLKIWLSTVLSLVLSGIVPLLRVIYTFWKQRQIQIMGCIFLVTFTVSGILTVVNGNARIAIFRDSIINLVLGLVFLMTLIPIKTRWFVLRPFIFFLYRQIIADDRAVEWTDASGEQQSMSSEEWLWTYDHLFRKYCYICSTVWGAEMIGEFIAKIIMVQSSLSAEQIITIGNIAFNALIGTLFLLTAISLCYVNKRNLIERKQWLFKNDYSTKIKL